MAVRFNRVRHLTTLRCGGIQNQVECRVQRTWPCAALQSPAAHGPSCVPCARRVAAVSGPADALMLATSFAMKAMRQITQCSGAADCKHGRKAQQLTAPGAAAAGRAGRSGARRRAPHPAAAPPERRRYRGCRSRRRRCRRPVAPALRRPPCVPADPPACGSH